MGRILPSRPCARPYHCPVEAVQSSPNGAIPMRSMTAVGVVVLLLAIVVAFGLQLLRAR